MIICPLDHGQTIPDSVSLTTHNCKQASNNLQIINNQPKEGRREMFGVCSKQLYFEKRDFGIQFIEWVHLLKILGAHKIHLYKEKLHKDVEQVVDFFDKNKLIEIQSFEAPSDIEGAEFATSERRVLEMNLLHDCLYKVKNLYEYIIVIDTDEIIMPSFENHRNWSDLISYLKDQGKGDFDSYGSNYVGFLKFNKSMEEELKGIPKYHQMLRRILVSLNVVYNGKVQKFYRVDKAPSQVNCIEKKVKYYLVHTNYLTCTR
jgi:hypothetical protein